MSWTETDTSAKTTSITLNQYMNQKMRNARSIERNPRPPSYYQAKKIREGKTKEVKNSNENNGNNRKKKTVAKVYGLNSEEELNEDFEMADNDNKIDNDDKGHIPRPKM